MQRRKTVYISEKAKYKRAIAAALSEFFAHGTYNGEELVPVPRRGFLFYCSYAQE